ncbi:ATP-binding protein [Serpentinicella sp. ANB-PHB4]|uniref:nucleotide-binding protein n=1 Tax=Serpentinicella sp. ANB-PHB4 TaxID=3074076 RepID=UPI0028647157|nr:ATP-binding protein [Serpentinicella sp. ANB-PHB4]MDR5659827.1 ATP-binding protein [Serpentinicella sp. ANB-PHB4]
MNLPLQDKRVRIIVGHYGSGKTEFAVNYALYLAQHNKKVALADLDIVNPYFRSREKSSLLEEKGIEVISSNVKGLNSDLPAVSSAIMGPLQDETYEVILDVGGDSVGARALARYMNKIKDEQCDIFFVLNANRRETQTPEGALEHINDIERVIDKKITGLINNTHLLRDTTIEDIQRGQALCSVLSKEKDIPIKYISVMEIVAKALPRDIKDRLFPLKMLMREDWM